IRRRQKAAEVIRFIVPPLSLVGYLQLRQGPLSRSVQNSQYLHFLFADFVHCEERTRQHEFASTLDAPGASKVWKRSKALNHAQDIESEPPRCLRSFAGDLVADPLQIVGSVRRPADAHQPR